MTVRKPVIDMLCALPLLACSVTSSERGFDVATTTSAEQWRTGQAFDDCHDAGWCPVMVVVPAGSFTMGSPPTDPGGNQREGPQRVVNIKQFAVGKFHVTRGQWAAFVSSTQRETHTGCAWTGRSRGRPDPDGSWRNLGFSQDDNHPVVCVSWQDVLDYVRWLSQRTGRQYRLLTEAEWEYSARAGTATAYWWGDSASHELANYGADVCCPGLALGGDRWASTSPVGSFPPNPFGLYDMNGNVMQFVQDCFAPTYAGLPTDGSAYELDVPLLLDSRTPSNRRDVVFVPHAARWGLGQSAGADSLRLQKSRTWAWNAIAELQEWRPRLSGRQESAVTRAPRRVIRPRPSVTRTKAIPASVT